MEMTITRALKELTLLDKRIKDATKEAVFVGVAKKSSKNVDNIYTRDEFVEKVKSNFQSVQDLMNRRDEIKSKIVKSNAEKTVSIVEKNVTVATAIEMKNTIKYKKDLLTQLNVQYRKAISKLNSENEKIDEKVYQMIKDAQGDDSKKINLEEDSYINKFRNQQEFELINPILIHEKIEELQKEIDTFESEIDYVLSESNAITKITLED